MNHTHTTPDATSSFWAVAADLTNALVAAAIAFAASKICSSKFNDSSASYRRWGTMYYSYQTQQNE